MVAADSPSGKYMKDDGTWDTPSGGSGSPAGNDTEIQFNDGGSFGADSDLTWNKITNALGLGESVITDDITVNTGYASFDGDDYIEIGNSITLGITTAFTLSAWIKDPTSGGFIICFDSGNPRGFQFLHNSGEATLIRFDSGNSAVANFSTSGAGLDDGNWHHICATFSTTNGSAIYIDGGAANVTDSNKTANNDGGQLDLGKRTYGTENPITGKLDDIMVFTEEFSQAENDSDLYGAGRNAGTYSGAHSGALEAYWSFDTQDATDETGNYDGTNHGTTFTVENVGHALKLTRSGGNKNLQISGIMYADDYVTTSRFPLYDVLKKIDKLEIGESINKEWAKVDYSKSFGLAGISISELVAAIKFLHEKVKKLEASNKDTK